MFGGMLQLNSSNSLTEEDKRVMQDVLTALGEEISNATQRYAVPKGKVPGAGLANVLAVLDRDSLHLFFDATTNPATTLTMRHTPDATLQVADIGAFAREELRMQDPACVSFKKIIMSSDKDTQRRAVTRVADDLVKRVSLTMDKPRALKGFEGLQPLLNAFTADHPDFKANVFVAMRFADTPQNAEIWSAIKDTLTRYGMKAHRADAKSYPQDDDLWANVCIYMMGCKYGICVFDQIDNRDFNPNVQIEYGFMRASDKRVLLLKDQRQPNMPVDITGKIRREFDSYNIAETVSRRVAEWAERDLGAIELF